MQTIALASLVIFCTISSALADPVPTTIKDFHLPGSQPNQSGQLQTPAKCDNCHGGYSEEYEPAFNWRGSMMAQAARDPIYFATLAIANQDAPESGDLCLRCHTPAGWLEGRSEPTDGSALNANDREGVQCDFCHKLVMPSPLGANPYPDDPDYTAGTYLADSTYLATLAEIPVTTADGMYVADASNTKRGPYLNADATHQFYYSAFHKTSDLCGTCHDVSNPAFSSDGNGDYVPNSFDAPAPDFSPYELFPVERTFSEWKMSEYNTPMGVYAPEFGGNKDYVSTCQDCHMRDVTGQGCNKNPPVRDDLPLHDMTGGNTFMPALVAQTYPGEIDPAALDSGAVRARRMLQMAASLEIDVVSQGADYIATVTVTNETGHKLPSGYPEGRRLWLHVIATDGDGSTVYESGRYDTTTAELSHDDDAKIYEIKPGISHSLAPIVNLDAGPSFHFVLNDSIYKDNRIPPRGFSNASFEAIQSQPVAYTYADGQYWDDTQYPIPGSAAQVTATLYYQTASKEFVEFLRDENRTNTAGDDMYNLWAANGKSAPVAMVTDTYTLGGMTDADGDGVPDGDDNCPNDYNPDQTDSDGDMYGAVCDCDDTNPNMNPMTLWYDDPDGDGFGTPDATLVQCEQPLGYVLDGTDNCPTVYNPDQTDTDGDGTGDACEGATCSCPYQGDYDDDGYLTAIDLGIMIDVLFAGGLDITDPECPVTRADLDCDGYPTSLDLSLLTDHLFAGGAGPCDPCAP